MYIYYSCIYISIQVVIVYENIGICVAKSTQALVIATYASPMSFQDCICSVEKLTEYLISVSIMTCSVSILLYSET